MVFASFAALLPLALLTAAFSADCQKTLSHQLAAQCPIPLSQITLEPISAGNVSLFEPQSEEEETEKGRRLATFDFPPDVSVRKPLSLVRRSLIVSARGREEVEASAVKREPAPGGCCSANMEMQVSSPDRGRLGPRAEVVAGMTVEQQRNLIRATPSREQYRNRMIQEAEHRARQQTEEMAQQHNEEAGRATPHSGSSSEQGGPSPQHSVSSSEHGGNSHRRTSSSGHHSNGSP